MAGAKLIGQPLRVLFVTGYYKPAYVYGGPARSVPALCEALAQAGCHVTVFTTNANGQNRLSVPTSQLQDVGGVEVWYFPLGFIRNGFHSDRQDLAVWRRVREFDLVASEILWGDLSLILGMACSRTGVPYIVSPRGQLLPWALSQGRYKKALFLNLFGYRYLQNAAAISCTDLFEAQSITKILPKAKTYVVSNGIDLDRIKVVPARGLLRERLGIPSEASVLLFLGRLHKKKRPDIAIQVLSALELSSLVHLIIVGPYETGELAEILSLASTLDVDDKVHVLGLLAEEELLQAIGDSDLMIMPSELQSENFGMSALEALAVGVPILVSDGVPVGKWAAQAGAGKIVSGDAQEFADAAREMLSDPIDLKEMGQRGRELVRQKFDIQIVARQMLDQFQSIVETGKPLPSNDN